MLKKRFYGWWIVCAAVFTFGLSTGVPYYNISFFYDYLARDYGWTREEITLGLPARGGAHHLARPARDRPLQPTEADPRRNGPDLHRALRIREDVRRAVDLLRLLGDLHGRLFHVRPSAAPDHRVALVPAQSRQSDGHRVCRRRADGLAWREAPGEAAHGERSAITPRWSFSASHAVPRVAVGAVRPEGQAFGDGPATRMATRSPRQKLRSLLEASRNSCEAIRSGCS